MQLNRNTVIIGTLCWVVPCIAIGIYLLTDKIGRLCMGMPKEVSDKVVQTQSNEPNDDWYMSAITMDDVNADDVLVFTDSDIDFVFDSNSVWTAPYDLPPGDVVNLVIIAENGDEVLITVDSNGVDVIGATREGARIFFEEYLKPIADEYIRVNCEN